MYFSQTLTAGVAVDLLDAGDFFRIIASAAEDVGVIFYKEGREVARSDDVGAGYFERIEFDKVSVTSAAGGLVRIVTRKGAQVGYDRAVGAVNISGTVTTQVANGAFTQATVSVNTVTTLLAAANANRRYLLVENKDATNPVYLNLAGAAATVAGGFTLKPGQTLEIQGRAPTGAINAIATGAAVSCVVSEG